MSAKFDVDNDVNHLSSSPIKLKQDRQHNSNMKSQKSASGTESKNNFEDAEEMESDDDPDYNAYFGNLLYTKHQRSHLVRPRINLFPEKV